MKKSIGCSKDKNSQIAIEGWFVGMVWPRVLVLRKCDMKVVAVSRKKVVCYESIYCLPPHEMPINNKLVSIDDWKHDYDSDYLPKSVTSVKLIEDVVKNKDSDKSRKDRGGHRNSLEDDGTVVDNQGEPFRDAGVHHEDNWAIDHELGPGIVKQVASELQKSHVPSDLRSELVKVVKDYASRKRGRVIARNELRRKKKKLKIVKTSSVVKPVDTATLGRDVVIAGDDAGEGEGEEDAGALGSSLDVDGGVHDDGNNSSIGNRTRSDSNSSAKSSTSSHAGVDVGVASGVEYKYVNSSNSSGKTGVQKKLYQMPRGTRVTIDTARFGKEYAKGKPSKEYGTLVK